MTIQLADLNKEEILAVYAALVQAEQDILEPVIEQMDKQMAELGVAFDE